MMGLFDNVVKQVSKTTDSVVKGVGKMGSDAAGAIAQTGNTIVKKHRTLLQRWNLII